MKTAVAKKEDFIVTDVAREPLVLRRNGSRSSFFAWAGFANRLEGCAWLALALALLPVSLYVRFYYLANPLSEPHPVRQIQTALTIHFFRMGKISFWKYYSPLNGLLWYDIFEFPLYQKLCALLMQGTSLPLEVASRLVSLTFFFLGAIALVSMVHRFAGRNLALWTALLYLISPFTVIYSRVCLIDVTAESFLLLYLWMSLEFLRGPSPGERWFWGVGTVAGALASTVKITVWVVPVTTLTACVAYRFWQDPKQRRRISFWALGLVLHSLIAMAWLLYTNHINGVLGTSTWTFGTLAERLTWEPWHRHLFVLCRLIYHDWMILPALMGLFCRRPYGALVRACALIGAIGVLLIFHVRLPHNYYFIGEAAFFLVVAAAGLVEIFRLTGAARTLSLAIVAICLVHSVMKLSIVYAPTFHDYRVNLVPSYQLKAMTTEDDIICYDLRESGREVQLYSDRLVFYGKPEDCDRQRARGLEPSVFKLTQGHEVLSVFKDFPAVWIDALDSDYFLYRVKPTPASRFLTDRNIAMLEQVEKGSSTTLPAQGHVQLDACGVAGALTLKVPPSAKGILITPTKWPHPIVMPPKAYLSLPRVSPSGAFSTSR